MRCSANYHLAGTVWPVSKYAVYFFIVLLLRIYVDLASCAFFDKRYVRPINIRAGIFSFFGGQLASCSGISRLDLAGGTLVTAVRCFFVDA